MITDTSVLFLCVTHFQLIFSIMLLLLIKCYFGVLLFVETLKLILKED